MLVWLMGGCAAKYTNTITSEPSGAYIIAEGGEEGPQFLGVTPYHVDDSWMGVEKHKIHFLKAGYEEAVSSAWTYDFSGQFSNKYDYHLNMRLRQDAGARNQPREPALDAGLPDDAEELDTISKALYGSMRAEKGEARVTAANAVLYEYPCTASPKEGEVAQYSPLKIMGAMPSGWVYVQNGATRGWVHSLALDKNYEYECPGDSCEDFEAELAPLFQKRQAEAAMKAMRQRAEAENRARQEALENAQMEAEARARANQPMIDDSNTFLAGMNNALTDFNNSMPDPLDLNSSPSVPAGNSGTKLSAASNAYPVAGGPYTFTCPDGNKVTLDIPSARSVKCLDVMKHFAVVSTCNFADAIPQANEDFMKCQ